MRAKRAKKINKKNKSTGIVICIILLLLIIIFSNSIAEEESIHSENSEKISQLQMDCVGQELKRKSFTICFNESKKIADYTYHVLTREMVKNKKFLRPKHFSRDPYYTSKVDPKDYTNSGYDRGHLVPADDLSTDSVSLNESMYMTNIAPQNGSKNRKQWKQLENHGRRLASDHDRIEVITGVMFVADSLYETIGSNKVAVPHYWYKIFKYKNEFECYIMRNEKLDGEYSDYRKEKKECETRTGVKWKS
jgi:endonuclease G